LFFLVEFDEFVKVMGSVYGRKFTDDEMQRAFKCFDTDNSGKIGFLKKVCFSLFFASHRLYNCQWITRSFKSIKS